MYITRIVKALCIICYVASLKYLQAILLIKNTFVKPEQSVKIKGLEMKYRMKWMLT
jgi:hypothetical protein